MMEEKFVKKFKKHNMEKTNQSSQFIRNEIRGQKKETYK